MILRGDLSRGISVLLFLVALAIGVFTASSEGWGVKVLLVLFALEVGVSLRERKFAARKPKKSASDGTSVTSLIPVEVRVEMARANYGFNVTVKDLSDEFPITGSSLGPVCELPPGGCEERSIPGTHAWCGRFLGKVHREEKKAAAKSD